MRARVQDFARGLEQIVVVEEKRGLIETQLKELLYGRSPASIVGKQDEQGDSLFPSYGALSSNRIAARAGRAYPSSRPGTTTWPRISQRCASATRPRRSSRARSCARPTSAPAARTTPRPGCPKAASPRPASAATTWRSGWTAAPRASPRWARKAPTGSARRRSPGASTSFRTSATAPTTTPGCWRSAPRSRRAST